MSVQFKVPNMACSACSDKITKAITQVDSAAKITADSKTKLVNVETTVADASVRQAIVAAGYTVEG